MHANFSLPQLFTYYSGYTHQVLTSGLDFPVNFSIPLMASPNSICSFKASSVESEKSVELYFSKYTRSVVPTEPVPLLRKITLLPSAYLKMKPWLSDTLLSTQS